jgi:hypothetical protein
MSLYNLKGGDYMMENIKDISLAVDDDDDEAEELWESFDEALESTR